MRVSFFGSFDAVVTSTFLQAQALKRLLLRVILDAARPGPCIECQNEQSTYGDSEGYAMEGKPCGGNLRFPRDRSASPSLFNVSEQSAIA